MFDFGWAELLVIAFIILLAVGPNDIPKAMYQAGRFFRRLHYLRFALTQQFDDFMEKAEAEKTRQTGEDKNHSDHSSAQVPAQASAHASTQGTALERDGSGVQEIQEEPEFAPSDPQNPHYVDDDDEIEADSALDVPFGHEFDDFADDDGARSAEDSVPFDDDGAPEDDPAPQSKAQPVPKKGGAS